MKIAIRRRARPQAGFEDEYRSSLREDAAGGGEPALGKAYELGRRALAEQKSLVEMASLHHQAALALVSGAESGERREELLRSSGEFLAECLSPYEMAHRGFQDAVKALRQLNETLEEEIKRIAYAVHDEAGQLLVAVHLALSDVATELPERQKEQIGRIQELLTEVEKQLRRYSHELRPTVLDDLGWIPAIRFLAEGVAKRASLSIKIKTAVTGRLPGPVEIALYRAVQEALANATKHAKASRVSIRIGQKNRVLCCSIEDDGAGFDVHAVRSDCKRRGLGLTGMQERLHAIGATLLIDSAPERGTKLLIQLPREISNANSNRAR